MGKDRMKQSEVEALVKGNPDVVMEGRVPVKEGIHDAGLDNPSVADLKSLPPIKRLELSNSISELSEDFVFFNHTMLVSKGGMDFDPFKEFQLWSGKTECVSYVGFDRPLFGNLGRDASLNCNNLLAFMPIEEWESAFSAVNKFTILNREKGYLYLCEAIKVKIPDPKCPGLTITPYVWRLKGSGCSWDYKGYPVPSIVKGPENAEAYLLFKALTDANIHT